MSARVAYERLDNQVVWLRSVRGQSQTGSTQRVLYKVLMAAYRYPRGYGQVGEILAILSPFLD